MLDTTEKAYTIYHCDEIIDEVAYRLTRGNWYGYKQFHDHFACVVVSGKQIELYFHPYTGYQALVIADGAPTYYSIKWKDYTGDVSHDADNLYALIIDMVHKYDQSLSAIQKDEQ